MVKEKMLLLFAFLPCLFLAACTSTSKKQEQKAVDCWANIWLNGMNDAPVLFTDGLETLDGYLKNKDLLGQGASGDYIRFVMDTQQVIIPESTPGFEKIRLFLEGSIPGAPDVAALMACIKDNIEPYMSEMDSSDVMHRFGRLGKALESAGGTFEMTFDFYRGLTKEEMDRPLIKMYFYLSAASFNYERPKICLGHRVKRNPIMISLPEETTIGPAPDTTE